MSLLRDTAIAAYCAGTQSRRRAEFDALVREGRAPVVVLFYHRVADFAPNDWTISQRQFVRHIEWLQKRFEIVSLADAQGRIQQSTLHTPTACLTFDDGYADNCETAIPYLLTRQIPFSYFVATQFIETRSPFPHDKQQGIPLVPNTKEQIRMLVDAGVDVGAHTHSHADLGFLTHNDPVIMKREIEDSIDYLEDLTQMRPQHFAFPYGMHNNMSKAAMTVLQQLGVSAVCSAYGDYNFPGENSFHIKRIHGDSSFYRFKNWMTLDPRKVHNRPPNPFADRFLSADSFVSEDATRRLVETTA